MTKLQMQKVIDKKDRALTEYSERLRDAHERTEKLSVSIRNVYAEKEELKKTIALLEQIHIATIGTIAEGV